MKRRCWFFTLAPATLFAVLVGAVLWSSCTPSKPSLTKKRGKLVVAVKCDSLRPMLQARAQKATAMLRRVANDQLDTTSAGTTKASANVEQAKAFLKSLGPSRSEDDNYWAVAEAVGEINCDVTVTLEQPVDGVPVISQMQTRGVRCLPPIVVCLTDDIVFSFSGVAEGYYAVGLEVHCDDESSCGKYYLTHDGNLRAEFPHEEDLVHIGASDTTSLTVNAGSCFSGQGE